MNERLVSTVSEFMFFLINSLLSFWLFVGQNKQLKDLQLDVRGVYRPRLQLINQENNQHIDL